MNPSPMTKASYKTPNPYESLFGYSRAVRKGPFIFVSGTTSIMPDSAGAVQYPGDAYRQTVVAFRESLKAVEALGGTKEDVVRVRMFVASMDECDEVGRGMKEVFGAGEWAATMIAGAGFVRQEIRVEVEVDAVVG
ncbi:uncharacterized protein H6S33_000200 [Morchella sextelata]|uniref:uncharacterized protein n=1 Tax=Morchella sextelata TaxID=1174677 RepID=UPI001D047591|nr:uncharacterized protein H6S33_000200 [Morchella sextelata]KAH0614564.1 hypothetical protein H6S33_000200 [Morchella sextelata]